ncbi:beta-lactamase family protein [candidate division KSB1 bacterium]|nr:beta-lactamase family protein [candidate division KSB1 bacterium]
MKIRNIVFILYLFLVQYGNTQSFEEVNPSDVGFIEERLSRIDSIITKSINNGEIPGAVALVARNGKIAYYKSFGYADVEAQKKIGKNSIFRIASMTKAITTVGVMVLHERGHFMLNDPISKYIPEFEKPKILVEIDSLGNVVKTDTSKKEIRIIDLLTHSSGLSYPFVKNDLQKVYKDAGIIDGMTSKEIILESQMKLLATLPVLFEPGSKFQYGLSIDLLGYLCEVISGKSFDRFLNDEIFLPLKMHDTYFYIPNQKRDRLVTVYSWIDGKGLTVSKGDESTIKLDNPNYPIDGASSYFSGGAGLSSTAYDYGRFIQMLLNNGELEEARIISRKSVELMRRSRIDWDNDGRPEFGFGFYVINDIAKEGELGSDGSYSWGGAFYTSYWIDPQENLIGVFMSQLRPSKTDVSKKFRSLVYQALE